MRRAGALPCLLLLGSAAGCSRRSLQGYRACLKLRVGMSREQALRAMGPPQETEAYVEGRSLPHMKGRIAYEWANPPSMPAPNRVVIDDAAGMVESIRCGDSQVASAVFVEPALPPEQIAPAASPSLDAPAPVVPAEGATGGLRAAGGAIGNGSPVRGALFVGHYGYAISVQDGFQPRPSFTPPEQVAEQIEVAPGGFTLTVLPKWFIARKTGLNSFDEYVSSLIKNARVFGASPRKAATTFSGRAGWTISSDKPAPWPDTTSFIDGAKVYYVFSYRAGSPAAELALGSLDELQPHDEPPAAATVRR